MCDIATYLKNRRIEIETRLEPLLPQPPACPDKLAEAMRHAVMVGGKRLRPIICLAAAETVGGSLEDAWPAALGLELLHSYTLVHDDLPCMDNDLLRRGQPTVHAKYGEAIAVLTGDALQTLAFETIANTSNQVIAARLVTELAQATGATGVIGGQTLDITCGVNATPELVQYVHQHKTALLFRAAARMGALAVNGKPSAVEQLSTFGNCFGLAFQIADDLQDNRQPPSDKPPELSCLHIMSPSEAASLAREYLDKAHEMLSNFDETSTPLRQLALQLRKQIPL